MTDYLIGFPGHVFKASSPTFKGHLRKHWTCNVGQILQLYKSPQLKLVLNSKPHTMTKKNNNIYPSLFWSDNLDQLEQSLFLAAMMTTRR